MNDFKHIIVGDRQCLIDIAIQEYGCYEGVVLLIEDNNAVVSWSQSLLPGMPLKIRKNIPKITDQNQAVATELNNTEAIVVSDEEALPCYLLDELGLIVLDEDGFPIACESDYLLDEFGNYILTEENKKIQHG